MVLQAHMGYTVKHIKKLLQPVYFHVAYKRWLLTEHSLSHCITVGSRSGSYLMTEEELDLSFCWVVREHGTGSILMLQAGFNQLLIMARVL